MHPDIEAYVWITLKALGVALFGGYAARIGLYVYESLKWAA